MYEIKFSIWLAFSMITNIFELQFAWELFLRICEKLSLRVLMRLNVRYCITIIEMI